MPTSSLRSKLFLPLLLGLMLAVTGSAAVAAPADPGYVIEREEFTPRFPDGMDFELRLRSDRPVTDVALRYFVGGSRVAIIARPEFTPGREIEVHWTLETGRALYLPPMADLRYEWELTDDRGQIIRTPARTVMYRDNRFHWQVVAVDGIELYYYGVSESRAREVAEAARGKVSVMEELLGTRLKAPVRGVVYSLGDIQSALSFRSETTTAEGHFGGEAYTALRLFTIGGMHPDGITHETTHVLLDDMTSFGKGFIPSWLNEGLAVFAERGQPREPERFQRALRLEAMRGVPSRRPDIALHYAQGYSVVAFLLREYGEEAMRRFILELSRATPVDEASQAAFGADLVAVENFWRTAVGLDPVDPDATPEPGADDDEPAPASGEPGGTGEALVIWVLPMGVLAVAAIGSVVAGLLVLRRTTGEAE